MTRVSQRQMFTNIVGQMNSNLSALMESNLQASSEKKINRPSDDPYGSAQVLKTRNTLDALKKYKENISSARGWLNASETAMSSVNDQLTRLFVLAEQASNGIIEESQRKIIGAEARQIFEQLVGFANQEFNGRTIFGGHKTNQPAFEMALGMTCADPVFSNSAYNIEGNKDYTTLIQFTGADGPISGQSFRYTTDGGDTWQTDGTITGDGLSAATPIVLNLPLAGQKVTIKPSDGTTYPHDPVTTQVDTTKVEQNNNGTWMYLRPSAIYKGDDNDAQVVQTYDADNIPYAGTSKASGTFSRDVAVRIDDTSGGVVKFSYSLDNGSNWIEASAPSTTPVDLPIPGGFLTLSAVPGVNDQFIVRPRRANIDLDIGANSTITTNFIGKDVFGGLYEEPFSTLGPQPVNDVNSSNMFEIVGSFIAALETNRQHGCQIPLDELRKVLEHVNTFRTSVGGRTNRLDSVMEQTQTLELDENDYLSTIEDVDVTELMTKLAQQQLAYNAVLKSSSMVMQMNLMNFL